MRIIAIFILCLISSISQADQDKALFAAQKKILKEYDTLFNKAESMPPCVALDFLSEKVLSKVDPGKTGSELAKKLYEQLKQSDISYRAVCRDFVELGQYTLRDPNLCKGSGIEEGKYREAKLKFTLLKLKFAKIAAAESAITDEIVGKIEKERLQDFYIAIPFQYRHRVLAFMDRHANFLDESIEGACAKKSNATAACGTVDYLDYVEKGEGFAQKNCAH